MPINRPSDLFMGADTPPPMQTSNTGPPRASGGMSGGGMNPGGLQAVKAGIQALLKMGLDEEQIVEAILKLAAESGMDIPEEEIRALIEQTAGEGSQAAGAGPPAQGAPPQGAPAELPAQL